MRVAESGDDSGGDGTVGIEAPDGIAGVSWADCLTEGSVPDETAVVFSPPTEGTPAPDAGSDATSDLGTPDVSADAGGDGAGRDTGGDSGADGGGGGNDSGCGCSSALHDSPADALLMALLFVGLIVQARRRRAR